MFADAQNPALLQVFVNTVWARPGPQGSARMAEAVRSPGGLQDGTVPKGLF